MMNAKPIILMILAAGCLIMGGCFRFSDDQHAGVVSNTATSDQRGSILPITSSSYPGPYKTIDFGGTEYRQGRFPAGKFGGSLIRSIVSSDPKTFNPWVSSDGQSSQLAGLMFSGLVGIDPYTGETSPDMAKEIKAEPDGVTYTTVLRKGLKWSDGQPVTAYDVAFTWNTIIAGGYGNASFRDVTSIDGKSPTVTVVDNLTNKFVTPKPFAPFLRALSMSIAPRHVIEPMLKSPSGREAFQHLWSAAADLKHMVTLGPFTLVRYVPGQRVEFFRSKNYYVVNQDRQTLPYLDRITYQIVPDVNTNLLKFKAKELDITPVRARDVPNLLSTQKQGNYTLHNLGQSIGTTFIMFNLNRRKGPDRQPYVDPVKSAWFNDVNFRQAVNHAINRSNIVQNYFKGIGFALFTAESPSSPFLDKTLKSFPPDVDYALSLLKKSGFTKHADGYLYDSHGHKVEFDLLAAAGGTFYEAVGGMIADDLKKLGMKVNFQLIDFNVLADRTENALTWQACLMSLSPGDPLEPNDAANVYKSDGRLHLFDLRVPDSNGKVAVTDARPWEKDLDQIFADGATTLDKARRKEIYSRYQKIVYDQSPFIFLVSPMSVVALRNTFGNYYPTELSQSSMGLHNLDEIYKK